MDLSLERQIYNIVLDAQEQDPEMLAGYLDHACKGNEQVRREVEKRLSGLEVVLKNARKFQALDSD